MATEVINVKMMRGDNTAWGFRLQGGKDFSAPVSVQRVNPNSLADQAGLQSGDIILKIMGQPADSLRHKEAQDVIVKSGNMLEMAVQRGGMKLWKPSVTPVGKLPTPNQTEVIPVTKTSLAANKQEFRPIGSAHNVRAKPFLGGGSMPGTVPAVVHKQYNSPAPLYSLENIAETLSAQTEVLASGAKGINFLKGEQPINTQSAVYRMVHEQEVDGKGDEDETYFVSRSIPNTQSHSFHQLRKSLDAIDGDDLIHTCNHNSHVEVDHIEPPGRSPLSPMTRHVEAPVFKPKSDKPADTSGNQSICFECGRLIVGVFVRIKDRSFHAECFRCATCGTSLKNVGYFNVNEKLYCDIHAKQAARMITGTSNLEPLTITPGSAFPQDIPVLGVGATPPTVSPFVNIGSPSKASGPHSPSTPTNLSSVSPIPFHAPKSTTPISTLYTHPLTAPLADAHKAVTGGSKFTWPPPKQPQSPVAEPTPAFSSNASPSLPTYRPPPGTQHVSYASQVLKSPTTPAPLTPTTPLTAKAPPLTAPKPHPPAQTGTITGSPLWAAGPTSGPSSAGSTPSTPMPGVGSMGSSRPAPRRGRGQLKSQVGPGGRIPICAVCGTPIRGPFVLALGKSWCPDHFLCANSRCRRPLQDVGFVEERGQLYCELCYENFFAPLCSKCGSRIKGDCLNALDKQWHPDCFVCVYCKKPFGNSSFYMEDGMPYCEKDWNELFTTKCIQCGYPIEAGDRWVEALNNNYHSQCFKCTICHKNLEGQSFYAKGGRPFCKVHAR